MRGGLRSRRSLEKTERLLGPFGGTHDDESAGVRRVFFTCCRQTVDTETKNTPSYRLIRFGY